MWRYVKIKSEDSEFVQHVPENWNNERVKEELNDLFPIDSVKSIPKNGELVYSESHILCNMYALYIIGSQVENYFGKIKYIIIYVISAITASLLSMLLNMNTASIGASGAIFGLMGSLLYFGINYRLYLGSALTKEILPVIVLNLLLGFTLQGVDNFAHLGGLLGGFLTTMAVGISIKKDDRVNGIILTILYISFLVFMNFFYA